MAVKYVELLSVGRIKYCQRAQKGILVHCHSRCTITDPTLIPIAPACHLSLPDETVIPQSGGAYL
jgi:hypothetical protein